MSTARRGGATKRREERLGRDAALDLDPGPRRQPARHAGVRRRRAVGGDRRAALRPPRLPARGRGVHRCLPRRVADRDTAGFLDRGRGQRDPAVLGPDGLGSLFLTGNCDGLLPLLHGPERRADGARRPTARPAVGDPRHDRRCGSAGSPTSASPAPTGPRGPLPDRRARRRRAAPGRGLRLARTTRVVVLGRAFMVDGDPGPAVEAIREGVPHLPLCARRRGHGGGGVPRRRRSDPRPGRTGPRAAVHRGVGVAFNTIAPNDFGYWETVEELVRQSRPGRVSPS